MNTPLIEFRNVTVSRDGTTALHSVNLAIGTGEDVAILGPNGSGKSSLIKTITRECYPRLGSSVRILGEERWNLFDLRAQLGIVSNDLEQTCRRDFTARETVLSGFFGSIGIWRNHHVTPGMEARADEVLELMEVSHLAGRDMTEMSSGEARRVVIGRALVHRPKALVLDEPTTSLDFRAKHELLASLRRLAQAGTSIVLVTHSLTDIIPEIGRVVLLKQGRIVQDGSKAAVLTPAALEHLFETPIEIVERNGYYHMW